DAASRIGWSDSDERSPQECGGLAGPGIPRGIDGVPASVTLANLAPLWARFSEPSRGRGACPYFLIFACWSLLRLAASCSQWLAVSLWSPRPEASAILVVAAGPDHHVHGQPSEPSAGFPPEVAEGFLLFAASAIRTLAAGASLLTMASRRSPWC